MAKKLKVAVIGTGGISQFHMPGWQKSPHAEVVAGCDVVQANLDKWGEKFGVKRLTNKTEDIINDPKIDVVDICTPNQYHEPLAIAALDAGKHVICEKPLAPTPKGVRNMIAARDRSGKLLMTAQHFRFQGNSRALMAEIKAGALGDVYYARAWWLRRNGFPGSLNFWSMKHSGGGACIDIGVHVLDLSLWMMGNPKPVSVSGVARTILAYKEGQFSGWGKEPVPPGADVDEFASAYVRFENGASLSLEASWLLNHNTPGDDLRVWLYGTDGGCEWPKCEIYQSNFKTKQLYNTALQMTENVNPPHAQECIEFAQAIVDGAPSPVPPEQSLQVISILDAVYRSQKSGREVRLD